MKTFREAMTEIAGSLKRGVCTAVVGLPPPTDARAPFALTIGAPEHVPVLNGHVICMGMTRDQVLALRNQCDEALAQS